MSTWTKVSPDNDRRNPKRVSEISWDIFPVSRMSLRVWFCLGLIALAHLFVGYQIGGRLGLFIGLLLAISLTFLVFYFSIPALLRDFDAEKLEGQDAWGLLNSLENLAQNLEMPTPSLYRLPMSTPLAFSLGRPGDTAAIALSEGLLNKLNPEEIQAVLAHQISHLRTIDTFRVGVSSSLAHAFMGLAQVLDQALPVNWIPKKSQQKPFEALLSPIAALFIRLVISDKDFYANDDLAASLIPNKQALATAIWKMHSYSQTEPTKIIACTSHLFIVNPEGLKDSNWFFVTHPSLESRVKRLVGSYPL